MAQHLNPKELLKRYSRTVWFARPGDREFDPKGLPAVVKFVKQKCNDKLVSGDTTLFDFVEIMLKYEQFIVDFISKEILKSLALAQSFFAISGTSGNRGQSVWVKDPFVRDKSLDVECAALSNAAAQTFQWLAGFADNAASYFCKAVFSDDILASITKALRDRRMRKQLYT